MTPRTLHSRRLFPLDDIIIWIRTLIHRLSNTSFTQSMKLFIFIMFHQIRKLLNHIINPFLFLWVFLCYYNVNMSSCRSLLDVKYWVTPSFTSSWFLPLFRRHVGRFSTGGSWTSRFRTKCTMRLDLLLIFYLWHKGLVLFLSYRKEYGRRVNGKRSSHLKLTNKYVLSCCFI